MTQNKRRALVALLYGIGLIVILVSLVTDFYDFIPDGLLGGVATWIIAIVFNLYFAPERGPKQ